MEHLNSGIQLAKEAQEARLRDAETQHRISHLNRTGQTTQAYQLLTNMSKKSEKQGKIMLKVGASTLESSDGLLTLPLGFDGLVDRFICRKLGPP
jgi:hypothetical protein